jgi:hypothetical protein
MNTETQIPENETIAQKAYRLLSSIPAEQWCVGEFSDGVGACCALGHWTRLNSDNPEDYSEDNCWEDSSCDLRKASRKFMEDTYGYTYANIASVNNETEYNGYNEPVIKERVLHLLTDMITAGY